MQLSKMEMGLGFGFARGRGAGFAPSDLGAELLFGVDLLRADLATVETGGLAALTDMVSGAQFAQSSSSARPAYNASGFNGWPNANYDGFDDRLSYSGTLLPGGGGFELWALIDQTSLAADTGSKDYFGFGGNSSPARARFLRAVDSGVNRARALIPNGTAAVAITNTGVDLSGRHVVRTIVETTQTFVDVDGVQSDGVSVSPAILTASQALSRIGATAATTAGAFFGGGIPAIYATALLGRDSAKAAAMYAFLNRRK